MPKYQIEVNGQQFEVDAPDDQALATAIGKISETAKAETDVGNQKVDASTVYVDEMLFGLPGKAAAGLNAVVRAPFTDKTIGEEYDTLRQQYQNARKQYAEEHPIANTAASIGGAVHGGATLAAGAGNVIGNAAPRLASMANANYGTKMAVDAASGAVQGGLSAYGHDESVGAGALLGGVTGGLARPVVDLGSGVVNAAAGLVGLGNTGRAQNAIAEALSRSGKSVDDVSDDLARASQDGQPDYWVADSLGKSGQRMLSGIARSPGDQRQVIAEKLTARQMDQGGRVAAALQDASGSPLTASQYKDMLEQSRGTQAKLNYDPVKTDITPIDITEAVRRANKSISPIADNIPAARDVPTDIAARLGIESGEASIRDPIRDTVKEARAYLASDKLTVTNVEKAFRAKNNIDMMIAKATEKGQGKLVEELMPVQAALDDALARTSKPYAAAREAYRKASQNIEAIDMGRQMAMPRARLEDNLNAFGALPDDAAMRSARVGYFDPLITQAENRAGQMSNSVRPLLSNKMRQELPVMAAPGRSDTLMNRLAREQTMFDTATEALGGSKTADNLADMADIQSFDPAMIGALLSGNIKGAAVNALTKGVNTLQGRNQATRDLIAKALMETGPTRAKAQLAEAVARGDRISKANEAIIKALIAGGSATPQRLMAGQ